MTEKIVYKTQGTCSSRITLEVEDGIIRTCQFDRGCSGNLDGLSRLIVGRPAAEVADLLEGIQCQNGTSCPDQLSKAIKSALSPRVIRPSASKKTLIPPYS